MTGCVVDASVLVKWLVEEELSDAAAALLDGESTFVAPALAFVEAGNALWAMYRRGDMTAGDLSDAVEILRAAPVSAPVSMQQLLPSAVQLAVDLGHPVYDCVYLALALQTRYPVVTADTRFYRKVNSHPYLSDLVTHLANAASQGPRP